MHKFKLISFQKLIRNGEEKHIFPDNIFISNFSTFSS